MIDFRTLIKKNSGWIEVLSVFILVIVSAARAVAQADEIIWTQPINLSNSEATSTDPFLLSDPSGLIHLFWAEKLGEVPGNAPDTILYSNWDGDSWTQPTDIHFAPLSDGNPIVGYPTAVIDNDGIIHLIWLEQPNFPNYAVYYSYAPSWEAGNASSWSDIQVLASDLTGSKYSIDLAIRSTGELHLVYGRGNTSANPGDLRAVTYLTSKDGGMSWSEPVDIYRSNTLERGASDTKLLLQDPEKIYISWTEWDLTGNGQVVYFIRSIDNGKTWEQPVALANRIGNEYERDWNNMALIAEDQIVAIWEGGWRAYRHVTFSSDGGMTWTPPVDVFPFLIGDNGAVDFVEDGNGQLHVFVASRVREGNLDREDVLGLWHSVLEQGTRWREPQLMVQSGAMTNPKVVVVNGNRIVAVWYESQIFDILAMTGEIVTAPFVPSIRWDKNFIRSDIEPTKVPAIETQEAVVTPVITRPSPQATEIPPQTAEPIDSPTIYLILGLIPAVIVIALLIVWQRLRYGGSS